MTQQRNSHVEIGVVFPDRFLSSLEQELDFWGEVRNPRGRGLAETTQRSAYGWIATEDPTIAIGFQEHQLERPWRFRRAPESPWSLQLMLLETDGDRWIFRRDPTISGPLSGLGKTTATGIPYLAPEIQLLFKARKETIGKDDADFNVAIPLLSHVSRSWLLECLTRRFPDGHEWIARLNDLIHAPQRGASGGL